LIDYVNRQPLNSLVTCLGDGHDGIWNQIRKFNADGNRREILDWYHLVENLYKVAGSRKRLSKAKELLWQGRIDETMKLFGCAVVVRLLTSVNISQNIGIELSSLNSYPAKIFVLLGREQWNH
jgi:hypothetical protein